MGFIVGGIPPAQGQKAYTTPGTYSWTAPAGVTSVSVVAVGGGGSGYTYGGGGGGGLGWKNNITVVPGTSYTVVVGAGGSSGKGGDSYFINATTVKGGGAPNSIWAGYLTPNGGSYVGDGGGNGGIGGRVLDNTNGNRGGGGGAGGYSGTGGNAGTATSGGSYGAPSAGTGGAGGGGYPGGSNSPTAWQSKAQGGGGVGLLGEGTSGSAGGTNAGSGGQSGNNTASQYQSGGGTYGGGGFNYDTGYYLANVDGAGGAVRIIWGAGRAFPSTNTGNLTESGGNSGMTMSGTGLGMVISSYVAPAYYIGTLSGLAADSGNNVVADNSGNSYILGSSKVVKLTASGSISWQKSLGTSTADSWGAVDSSDNIHVTSDNTVVKYNSSGSLQWQRSLLNTSWQAVAVDSSSNVYLTGYSFGTVDIITAKYNSSGALQWQRCLATSSNYQDQGFGIAVDSSGNVYVGGADQTNKGYIAKYNSLGTIQWQKSIANAFRLNFGYVTGRVRGVSVDSSDNVYVGLELLFTVASTASMDVLLVKLDSSGNTTWQRRLSGSGADRPDYFTGMTTDSTGNTYLTSRSSSSYAISMFKYNSSGTIQWQRDLVNPNNTTDYNVGGISVSSSKVFVAGTTTVSGVKGGYIAALPLDGTKTGTYSLSTVIGSAVTYQVNTSFTDSAESLTIATSSLTASTSTLTEQAGTLTESTPSLTVTTVTI